MDGSVLAYDTTFLPSRGSSTVREIRSPFKVKGGGLPPVARVAETHTKILQSKEVQIFGSIASFLGSSSPEGTQRPSHLPTTNTAVSKGVPYTRDVGGRRMASNLTSFLRWERRRHGRQRRNIISPIKHPPNVLDFLPQFPDHLKKRRAQSC